jgi:hypothetical protein
MADAPEKSPQEIEREQEAMLKAKYGGLKPKKKLIPKDHKYFDSADWAMAKEGVNPKDGSPIPPQQEILLPPKLEPSNSLARRISHLDPMDNKPSA